jgi:TRAP-type C4-dicarboxylate transport system permease small subunit
MVLVRQINDWITKTLMVIAAIWALFLGFYILADVIARNLNMPIPGTQEIVRDSIVCVVFLQLAYCVKIGGMLRADFLVAVMSPAVSRALTVLGYIGAIAFFLAILYGSWGPALDAWRTGEFQGDGALRVPTWPSRFAIILGCALVAFNYVILIIDEITGHASAAEPAAH